MQVFCGWYFVVGNVHFHKLLILKIIEELCATVDHLQNNWIPSRMKFFVNSQFTSASLVKFFIGLCTEAQSVCAFIFFIASFVQMWSWKVTCAFQQYENGWTLIYLKYIFYLINFLVFLVKKCVVINLGELCSIHVLQCYENPYNCELFQCFRIFYLLIHACFDIIILKLLILQFHLGEFSIIWEVCDVCIL